MRRAGRTLIWRSWRFGELLIVVLAFLLLLPFQLRLAGLVLQLVILHGILTAVSATQPGASHLRRFLIGGWFVNLVLQAGFLVPDSTVLIVAADAGGAAILVLCVVVILHYVIRSSEITADTIFASIVAYLFIALAFSRIYVVMQHLRSGSFGPAPAYNDLELVYFSFVTMATLGYGDLVPKSPTAQMVAVVEAVVGQFYVAVLVAWLVSVHAGRRERRGA
jgi:hypothetical protein